MSRFTALAGIAVAGLSIATAGCGHVYMSEESSNAIRSIEIDPKVAIPDRPDVDGPVDAVNNLLVGLMIGGSPLPPRVDYAFGAYMDTNGVKVDEIVLRQFRRYLNERDRFELREGGDATLELAVANYGFKMPGFDVTKNMRRPEMVIVATLKSRDSTVLWKKHDYLLRGSALTQAHSIQALWENPRLVERSLEQASCLIAYLLLSDLHPKRQSEDEVLQEPYAGPVCDPVVKIESRVECKPGVGCTQERNESWVFRPSQDPHEMRKFCSPDAGCTYK